MPWSALQTLEPLHAQQIRLIATDMDGTLTTQGQFTATLLQTLEQLAIAQIPVVIVTGRSAGWVSGVVEYLPVFGAIAENGGLFFPRKADQFWLLADIADFSKHRKALEQMFQSLQQEWPTVQESSDNRFRLTDWTFDVTGLTPGDLQQMGDRCQANGFGFTYSTVQCHIKLPAQDKASGLLRVLHRYFPSLSPTNLVTVGDSPNDEPLFAPVFPLSVGVANVLEYRDRLTYPPAYVTQTPEGQGFCELAQYLLTTQTPAAGSPSP